MQVHRISKVPYAGSAYSGAGSLIVPGRWHGGVRVVYAAASIALAALEVFVNLNPFAEPGEMVRVTATLPDKLIGDLPKGSLAAEWVMQTEHTHRIGNAWITAQRSLALRVPSAVVAGDWNILLNPQHPDFPQVAVEAAQPFRCDPRMFHRA